MSAQPSSSLCFPSIPHGAQHSVVHAAGVPLSAYYFRADCLRVLTTLAHVEGSWKLRTSLLLSEHVPPWHQQVLQYLYQDANPWGLPCHAQTHLETAHLVSQISESHKHVMAMLRFLEKSRRMWGAAAWGLTVWDMNRYGYSGNFLERPIR